MEPWEEDAGGSQDSKWYGKEAPEGRMDPKAQQPRRGGDMPPEGRSAMEFLAKPGQFEGARPKQEEYPELDGAEPLQQEAAQEA
eukprot:4676020-Heterocapsa_arctica.AAC.1